MRQAINQTNGQPLSSDGEAKLVRGYCEMLHFKNGPTSTPMIILYSTSTAFLEQVCMSIPCKTSCETQLTTIKGKTILTSLIIENLQERKVCPVLFFYCKHNQPEKTVFTGILRGLLAQLLCEDTALAFYLYEICASKDQVGVSTMLEQLAEIAFNSKATSLVILDGLDECKPGEAEKVLSWFKSRLQDTKQADHGHIRLLCVGQRVEVLQRMLSSAADIALENASHQGDIEQYVKEQACNIREVFDISSLIEAEIVTRVTNAAKSRKPAFISTQDTE